MDAPTVVWIVVGILCGAILAVVLKGHFDGKLTIFGATLWVKAGREPEPHPGAASIIDSIARQGDAIAIGLGGARIEGTDAGGSLIAQADGECDPKP